MFSKKELIVDLLMTYDNYCKCTIDSEIVGMTKEIDYLGIKFIVSADDYDKVLEIMECIGKERI